MKHRLLIADDDSVVLSDFLKVSLSELPSFEVKTANNTSLCLWRVRKYKFDVVLLDMSFNDDKHDSENELPEGLALIPVIRKAQPSAEIIVYSNHNSNDIMAEARKRGADDYQIKSVCTPEMLAEKIKKALLKQAAKKEAEKEGEEIARRFNAVAKSKEIKELYRKAAHARKIRHLNVIIEGPTGAGKEIVASIIGYTFGKAPYISVNCATIRGEFIESKLFGHERGAFTDAVARKEGFFFQANGGVLFLDEIGCLPMSAQEVLLRILQTGEFRRMGGDEVIKVNVRVICATNDDLKEKVKQGIFREDLYERLGGIKLEVPSLAEHPDDIIPLAEHFLRNCSSQEVKIDKSCEIFLKRYRWPRNVRQLDNTMQSMAGKASVRGENEIDLGDLPDDILKDEAFSSTLLKAQTEDKNETASQERSSGFWFNVDKPMPFKQVKKMFAVSYVEYVKNELGPDVTVRRIAELLDEPKSNISRMLKESEHEQLSEGESIDESN